IVAAGGLAAALPLAWWSTQAFTTMVSFALVAPLPPMTPDRRVLVIATFVTVVTGLLITALPAWRAVNSRVDGFLRSRRAMGNSGGRSGRARLVVQIAGSMVLVVSAGLL